MWGVHYNVFHSTCSLRLLKLRILDSNIIGPSNAGLAYITLHLVDSTDSVLPNDVCTVFSNNMMLCGQLLLILAIVSITFYTIIVSMVISSIVVLISLNIVQVSLIFTKYLVMLILFVMAFKATPFNRCAFLIYCSNICSNILF